jgi:hypothetical protein
MGFLLVAPVALAQPPDAGAASPAPPQPMPGAPAPMPAPMPESQPTITGPQMLEMGQEYRKEAATIRQYIQGQVEAAKQDKDIIRMNCLLDKLTQLGAREKIMEQSLMTLQEAVLRQDASTELHEYTRITIVHQKIQELRTEADACVGAETNYVGPTKVVVETPPGLEEGVDQPQPAAPPYPVVDRPIPASPYR